MKTTLEIPDRIFRKAKSAAADRGIAFREFVTEAVREKLTSGGKASEKPWIKHLGGLKHLKRETKRINKLIEKQTEQIDEEIWS